MQLTCASASRFIFVDDKPVGAVWRKRGRRHRSYIAMSPGGKIGEFQSVTGAEAAVIASDMKQKRSRSPCNPV
jgi:hypothetical protein